MSKNFLSELQKEASIQKKLNQERIFPEYFDGLTSLIGNYPWQTLLLLSAVSTILLELLK